MIFILKVCITFGWCFWKLQKNLFKNLSSRSYKIFLAPGLAWQAPLKKAEVKLELLTDIDMVLMVEKGITAGICPAIYWYGKANNKQMEDYDNNKASSYLSYCNVNYLYG